MLKKYDQLIGTIVIIAILFFLIVFALGIQNPSDFVKYGAWGDLFGGFLNPIFAFGSLIALLATLRLQMRELEDTRKELARSATALESQISANEQLKFDSTFFELLKLYNGIVSEMSGEFVNGREPKVGRDRVEEIYKNLLSSYLDIKNLQIEHFIKKYNENYQKNSNDLGHYFRVIYNIFRFIDENPKTQSYHIRVFRAHFSDHELGLIFFNCLTDQGEKLKWYVEKYSIFDNLPESILPNPEFRKQFDPSAFDSTILFNQSDETAPNTPTRTVRTEIEP